jgi:hypothetical protein
MKGSVRGIVIFCEHAAYRHHRVARRVQISIRLRVQGLVSIISLPNTACIEKNWPKTCEAAQEELSI